jgi:hypothetical protein
VTIKAFSSVNLLDSKHYSYSVDQLEASAKTGSLAKKKDKLVIRRFAPTITQRNVSLNRDAMIPSRERSLYNIKEEHYEELNISDEDFAKENADTAQIDANKQVISKG